MIEAPWNVILTIVFSATLALCIVEIVQDRRQPNAGRPGTGEIVHIGHGIMSIAMIVMTWASEPQWLLWVQVGIFVLLALWLLPSLFQSEGTARTDLLSHLVLYVAMIWMLAAMDLLMRGMSHGEEMDMDMGDMEMDMSGMDGASMEETPTWANIVNWIFVAASAVVALWWVYRFITDKPHRRHAVCHFLMGAGMAIMLVLMNG